MHEPIAEARYVDSIAIGLPARRFRFRATVAYDTSVPLVTEFVLRLLRIVGDLKVGTLQSFFGLSNREVLVMLRDLAEDGLIDYQAGLVQLGPKGRAAFQHGDSEDPRIVAIEEVEPVVAFDRATASPLDRSPYMQRPNRALLVLPTKERDRASRLSSEVSRSFQTHFKELLGGQVRVRGASDRAYLYSVDEVAPRKPFTYELNLPIVLDVEGQLSSRLDFTSLYEKGLKGSRDELIAQVSEFIGGSFAPHLDALAALQFIATFDGGFLSRFLDASTDVFNLHEWISFVDAATNDELFENTVPLLGSASTAQVSALLYERTQETNAPAPGEQVLWVRPSIPYWGRSSNSDSLLSDLANCWGLQTSRVLISTSEDSLQDNELARSFRSMPGGDAKFHCGISANRGVLPGALEILIRPGSWLAAFAYISVDANSPRTPVGFFSADKSIVGQAGVAIARRLNPIATNARIAWGYPELSFNQVRDLLQRDIEFLERFNRSD